VARGLLDAVRRAAADVPGAGTVAVSACVGVAGLARRPAAGGSAAAGGRDGGAADGPDVLSVLVESAVALRAAKEAGRGQVETYEGPVAASHRRSLAVERRLREVLDRGGLQVHYQPVLAMASRTVVGVEALARWDDDELGRVTPDEFIPVAERSGLIGRLGAHVLARAVDDLLAVRCGPAGIRIAVNVSPVQLRSATFADEVLALVRSRGLAPGRLLLEVTESVFVDEEDGGVRHLARLRAAGVQVAIDDFGSGYSSLAYLARLPATVLKVDRSLTARVLDDPRSQAVMRAVLELGRALSIEVVVEGIETQEEHDLVRRMGAGFGQGWLYAAAVRADALPAVVAAVDAQAPVARA
jgi:EAL domain-containing protein (putative c-di-GMP-specific phosphodiesterase class I)